MEKKDVSDGIITGKNLVGMLQAWIDSRHMGKMEIMQTPFSGFTILLRIKREGNSGFLLVDRVAQFENMLPCSPGQEVSFNFMENGALYQFRTRVIHFQPWAIWLELPSSIQRIQKRSYYRIAPTLKGEIIFRVGGKDEKARVNDYSLGGVSFFMESHQKLNPEEELKDLLLILPQGKATVSYPISRAIVRRIDEHLEGQKRLCALEFLKLEKSTQQELARHIFEEQRSLLRQGRRI